MATQEDIKELGLAELHECTNEGMLSAAIEAIGAMAIKAVPRDFVQAPGEPSHVYFERSKDGELLRRTAAPAPRGYVIHRVKDLIAAVGRLGAEVGAEQVVVFIGRQAVTAVLDEGGERRDRVRFPLTLTRPYAALRTAESQAKTGDIAGWMDQDDFVDFLRIVMAGCVTPEVVGVFRQLKFTNNVGGEGQVGAGRQQISRSILREVVSSASGTAVPEEIVFRVAVFEETWGDAVVWSVKCAVATDLVNGRFKLIPMAGELNKAMVLTQENLAELIAAGLPAALVVCGEVSA